MFDNVIMSLFVELPRIDPQTSSEPHPTLHPLIQIVHQHRPTLEPLDLTYQQGGPPNLGPIPIQNSNLSTVEHLGSTVNNRPASFATGDTFPTGHSDRNGQASSPTNSQSLPPTHHPYLAFPASLQQQDALQLLAAGLISSTQVPIAPHPQFPTPSKAPAIIPSIPSIAGPPPPTAASEQSSSPHDSPPSSRFWQCTFLPLS